MGSTKVRSLLAGFVIALATCTTSQAQTWDEWFRQKKTQLDYLARQIAELQLYGGYLKQGYRISQSGLGTIRGWAESELNLHTGYYGSLKTVSPELLDSPAAAGAIAYATGIARCFSQLDLTGLGTESKAYIGRVKRKVLEECDAGAQELQLVLVPAGYGMTDDERTERLNRIYADMKDRYQFTQSFTGQVKLLQRQKIQEGQDINTLKKYNGIN